MKTIPIAAAGLLAAILLLSPAFAAAATTYTVAVTTNATSYSGTMTISITGTISPGPGLGTGAVITITNPTGTQVFNTEATVWASGSFSASTNAGGTTL